MPPKKKRSWIPLLVLALCLVMGAAVAGYFYFLQQSRATLPIVLIHSPDNGAQVSVGQETIVRSTARDENKIRRIELWIDGQLQDAETSSLSGGASPLPLLTSWMPTAPGNHTLTVRAFNTNGDHAHASVSVVATELIDRDEDSVPDESDACPDQPGGEAASGCPDRDGDDIRDLEDQCPDQSGVPASGGCPMISEGDRDGDGLRDSADACPDQVGMPYADGCPDSDADGIQDRQDACPAEAGSPNRNGCPTPGDSDGDGIADAADECLAEPGAPETAGCPDDDGDGVRDRDDVCSDEAGVPTLGGCPDRDGDSVRDADDLCPDVPGLTSNSGCPDTGASDRDGDGVLDDADLDPDEPGTGDDGGSPPPGAGADADADGIADDAQVPDDSLTDDVGSLFLGPFQAYLPVEFEALEFTVNDDYTEVYCYARLANTAEERYPAQGSFDAAGVRRWDIATELGGANTRRVAIPPGDPLGVHVECAADDLVYESDGAWGSHYDLGSIAYRHPISDFDGHVITAASTGGSDGHNFEVKYRICPFSCEQAEFRPPIAYDPIFWWGDYLLYWQWEGDRTAINGFALYVNGNRVGYVGPDRQYVSIARYMPHCEGRNYYQLSAYRLNSDGTIRESPLSNRAELDGGSCPHTVIVKFERIITGPSWGVDEELSSDPPEFIGPIYGDLFANDETLHFDIADSDWLLWAPGADGYELPTNSSLDIFGIFDFANSFPEWGCGGGGCEDYEIPLTDSVTVVLGPFEDLTIGAVIKDYDVLSSNDTLFDTQLTIDDRDLRSGEYTLTDRNITLVVQVEVAPATEALACLAGSTLIDTPAGALPVRDLREGMPVWTANRKGEKAVGVILRTVRRAVPAGSSIVHLSLSDGREVFVSAGHPTFDGLRVGDLMVGKMFDGARVVTMKSVALEDGATYDILASGETGAYWADGILLGSTLAPPYDR